MKNSERNLIDLFSIKKPQPKFQPIWTKLKGYLLFWPKFIAVQHSYVDTQNYENFKFFFEKNCPVKSKFMFLWSVLKFWKSVHPSQRITRATKSQNWLRWKNTPQQYSKYDRNQSISTYESVPLQQHSNLSNIQSFSYKLHNFEVRYWWT
jgi:hypothetical protein